MKLTACLCSSEGSWYLEKLSVATQAAFNSSERQHDPLCLEKTRVDVLNKIKAWAYGQDGSCIYWLNGRAGTGKSTIARTIARECYDEGRLGASFFFSKGGGDAGHAGKFFTTLAFQLAKTSPILESYICDAVKANIDIKDQSLRDQWTQLILQPLSRLDENFFPSLSYIFVVDALDECEGEGNIRAIIQLLAEAQSLKKVQLRVFLTSRPEVPIRYGFHPTSGVEHEEFILHNISPPIIDHDIQVFLKHNLELIGEECSLNADWTSGQIIERLIQKASGLFIWAATACRFIRDGKQFGIARLNTILEPSNLDSAIPSEKHLDEIYVTVLKQCIKPSFSEIEKERLYLMLRQVLGSMAVLFAPLSANSLCRLLPNITKEEINHTLEDLHAILDVPKDQTQPLRLHHPSFRDFLIEETRCSDSNFWVDAEHAHKRLADSSIQLMTKSLKQNICGLSGHGMWAINSNSQVQQCLPQEVQYACLYWIQHLQRSGCQLRDDDQVHQFLKKHVLHWLEALGWMQKISEGIHAIISLESTVVVSLLCNII